VDGDLDAVAQSELGEDARDVALDSGLTEVEPGSDLGVGQALGYQPHDAEFLGWIIGWSVIGAWKMATRDA
jgi:hypothetical protein